MDAIRKTLEVKTPDGRKILILKRLLYVEADKKCSVIYMDNFKSFIVSHPLKWFEEYLEEPEFLRCHFSFMVNCRYIEYYKRNEVILKGNVHIKISRNKMNYVRETLIRLHENFS